MKIVLMPYTEKLMGKEEPEELRELPEGFRNEVISFQIAFRSDIPNDRREISVRTEGEIALRVRLVKRVPVLNATYSDADDDYLVKDPGLYPDRLMPVREHSMWAYSDKWECLWIDALPDGDTEPGEKKIRIALCDIDGTELAVCDTGVNVLDGELPPQKLIHTKWLHTDCIAQYYGVSVFSADYWRITRNFIDCAVSNGINTILTPIHTPPLDTRVGGERLTVQLVDIERENGLYTFDTSKLSRWIDMCRDAGVEYLEMAHLYTQWGAGHAPKIMATVDGQMTRLFGWETEALSEEYRDFLNAYIPAVRHALASGGYDDRHVIWHISDEPSIAHLESYKGAGDQVKEALAGCRVKDAMSSYAFYETGAANEPVVAVNHIEPFLGRGIEHLWAYYCCGQYKDVCNMFIAMPSYRNRILAPLLFRYDIEGFLQWGFNFYNTRFSDYALDPYSTADADGWVPAGDPFQVYPGENGIPEESLRSAVTAQALQDLRAMELLADRKGREYVKELIDRLAGGTIRFDDFPRNDEYLAELRKTVNREITGLVG